MQKGIKNNLGGGKRRNHKRKIKEREREQERDVKKERK